MGRESLVLDYLDGYQFEDLVFKIMKRRGFCEYRVTPRSRDLGKDLVLLDSAGSIVVVECKHQKFVGRPIVQKLQGAMVDESRLESGKKVKGMIVTSGHFSPDAIEYGKKFVDIELIDGKRLSELCEELEIKVFNGKVQIVTKKCFKHIDEGEAKSMVFERYSKIYGSKNVNASVRCLSCFFPVCYLKWGVSFDTYTSIGVIDRYSAKGELVMEGRTGQELDAELREFFFSGELETQEIEKEHAENKIPFEFTETDIEDDVTKELIQAHTHEKMYYGKNNVGYTKLCEPKKSDVDIYCFNSVYLPVWENKIKILQMEYKQRFFSGVNKILVKEDELKICKICQKSEDSYEKMSVCLECGRVVCGWHVKIDFLDKETPICVIHARSLRLYLQNKYFASKENRSKYKMAWESMNFFHKLCEDKIALSLSVAGMVVFMWLLINLSH